MNTLHTFGCSFTAFYLGSGHDYKDYVNFRNGSLPKTWPELLSDKLGSNLLNYGFGGNSNYEIFQTFCDNLFKINKDDVVVIGWSFKERFRLVNEKDNRFVRVDRGFGVNIPNISDNTIDEILCNRMNDKWCDEVRSWEKAIKKLSELLGFKLLIWGLDGTFEEHSGMMGLFGEMGAKTIYEETNGLVEDFHYGEIGHVVLSDYFFDVLANKIKYNDKNY